MNTLHNSTLTSNAQRLRREMTKEERHLWYDFLKELPIPIKRQKIIHRFIVDFYIPSAKLVIELDGSQHYDPDQQQSDAVRDACLRELGLQVLRYSNSDIHLRFDDVCQDIWNHLPQLQED